MPSAKKNMYVRKPSARRPTLVKSSVIDDRIGIRVRHARMTAGLLLRELAKKADCSESFLSKIENDRIMPSIVMLRRIASALDLTLGELFATSNETEQVVMKNGQRSVTDFDPLRRGTGIQLERLIPYSKRHLLQGNIHIIAPGGSTDGTLKHPGEEVGYVLEGQIELIVGDNIYTLNAGNSFLYRSETPHGYRNKGKCRARVLFINTPPTY